MTQEEKQLLLKDLSARLPYGVMMKVSHLSHPIALDEFVLFTIKTGKEEGIPYLRPISSLTKEEKDEINEKFYNVGYFFTQKPPHDYGLMVQHDDIGCIIISEFANVYDWLDANHFDYRGLIERGLALEAPEDMYK